MTRGRVVRSRRDVRPGINRIGAILAGWCTIRCARAVFSLISLILLLVGTGPTVSAASRGTSPAVMDTGYVIVKFHQGAARRDKATHHASMKASVFKEIRELNIDVIQIPDPATTRAVAAAYSRSPLVEYAEPDALMPLADASALTPNDPLFGNQWHHVNIQSQNAWAVTTGLPTTRITVCDTGVSPTHPDLQASLRADLGYNTEIGRASCRERV